MTIRRQMLETGQYQSLLYGPQCGKSLMDELCVAGPMDKQL
jgi:hypothetical protein